MHAFELSRVADTLVSAHPNAGLPNAMGEYDETPDDMAALEAHGYAPIDLVAVNLYPFRETVAAGGVPVAAAMKQVDIGGPTMIRAAAKNHAHVCIVVDPADYARVAGAIEGGGIDAGLRRELAARAFAHTAGYDGHVADWLQRQAAPDDAWPETLCRSWRRAFPIISISSGWPRARRAAGGRRRCAPSWRNRSPAVCRWT